MKHTWIQILAWLAIVMGIGSLLAQTGDVQQIECSIIDCRMTQREGRTIPTMTVRLAGGRILMILLHNGFDEIPVTVDGVRLPSVSQGGTDIVQNLRTTRLRAQIRMLQTGVAVPADFELQFQRQKNVRIESNPDAVQVFIGSRLMGVTPLVVPVWSGSFEATLKKDGYVPYDVLANLGATTNTNLRANLLRKIRIRVATTPEGVPITVNGELKGGAPIDIVHAGTNGEPVVVQAVLQGYVKQDRVFSINHETNRRFEIEMGEYDMAPRAIRIDSSPTRGADVYLGATRIGSTPCTLQAVGRTNGMLTIRRTTPANATFVTNISFDATSETNIGINVALDQEPRILKVENEPTRNASVTVNSSLVGRTPLTLTYYGPTNINLTVSEREFSQSRTVDLTTAGEKRLQTAVDAEPRWLKLSAVQEGVRKRVQSDKAQLEGSRNGYVVNGYVVYGPDKMFTVIAEKEGFKRQTREIAAGKPGTSTDLVIDLDPDWEWRHSRMLDNFEITQTILIPWQSSFVNPFFGAGAGVNFSLMENLLSITTRVEFALKSESLAPEVFGGDSLNMSFLNAAAGVRLNFFSVGPLALYAQAGLVVSSYAESIDQGAADQRWSGVGLQFGGGVMVLLSQSIGLHCEVSVTSLNLQNTSSAMQYTGIRTGISFAQ